MYFCSWDPPAILLPVLGWLANPVFALAIVASLLGGGRFVDGSFARRGGHAFVPASFSFGWFGYGIKALFRILYHGTLMPKSKSSLRVINLDNATAKDNHNWLISQYFQGCMNCMTRQIGKSTKGIRIAVFRAEKMRSPVTHQIYIDELFSTVLLVAQFGASIILGCMRNDWGVLNIFVHGTLLSFWIGCLPQWRAEKRPDLRQPDHTYALSLGRGHHDIMVVKCYGQGVNFDRLAQWQNPAHLESRLGHMVPFLMLLSLLYTTLTLETNQTVLCIVGILGMVDNIISSWWTREPYEWDMQLNLVDIVGGPNMMDGLMDYETAHGHGIALKRELFPEETDSMVEDWWNGDTAQYDEIRNKEWLTRTKPRSE